MVIVTALTGLGLEAKQEGAVTIEFREATDSYLFQGTSCDIYGAEQTAAEKDSIPGEHLVDIHANTLNPSQTGNKILQFPIHIYIYQIL